MKKRNVTPALLAEIGAAMYGETSWKTPLAADLGVAMRTVSRWENGDFAIPEGLGDELARLLADKAVRFETLRKKLAPTA